MASSARLASRMTPSAPTRWMGTGAVWKKSRNSSVISLATLSENRHESRASQARTRHDCEKLCLRRAGSLRTAEEDGPHERLGRGVGVVGVDGDRQRLGLVGRLAVDLLEIL